MLKEQLKNCIIFHDTVEMNEIPICHILVPGVGGDTNCTLDPRETFEDECL